MLSGTVCCRAFGLCQSWLPSHLKRPAFPVRTAQVKGQDVSVIVSGTGLLRQLHLLPLAWYTPLPTLHGTDNDLIRMEAEATGNPQRNH